MTDSRSRDCLAAALFVLSLASLAAAEDSTSWKTARRTSNLQAKPIGAIKFGSTASSVQVEHATTPSQTTQARSTSAAHPKVFGQGPDRPLPIRNPLPKPVPVKPAPVKPTPVKPTPVKPPLPKPLPIRTPLPKPVPVKPAPVKPIGGPVPVRPPVPVKPVPVKPTPVKPPLPKPLPVKPTPVEPVDPNPGRDGDHPNR